MNLYKNLKILVSFKPLPTDLKMKATFRTYHGLAGDLQELLIAKSDSGHEVSKLIPLISLFKYKRMKKAKRKLLKELELLTGKKHTEE